MIQVVGFAFLFTGFAFAQSVATAPINNIPGTAHVVTNVTFPAALTTNDVCNIVTNEVAEWECEPSEMYGKKISVVWYDSEMSAGWYPAFDGQLYFNSDPCPEDAVAVQWKPNQNWDQPFTLVAVRKKKNALGLAMAKDLEKLPDHETVTNVARAVSNSFWDEKNEVLWRMEFRDGEPMFVPVTNENVKATGGVL